MKGIKSFKGYSWGHNWIFFFRQMPLERTGMEGMHQVL